MGSIDNKRLQTIRFLASVGADTEKKITALTIDDIVMFDKVRTEDIRLIRQLQGEIKQRNVIGFLTKGTDTGLDEIEEESDDADDDRGESDGKEIQSAGDRYDTGSGNIFGSEELYRDDA